MKFKTVEIHGNKIMFTDEKEYGYEAVVKPNLDEPNEIDVYVVAEMEVSGEYVSVPKERYRTFTPEEFNRFLRSMGIWFNVYYKKILKIAEFCRKAIVVIEEPCIRFIRQEGIYRNFDIGDNILAEVLKRVSNKCEVLIKGDSVSEDYKRYIESNIGRNIRRVQDTKIPELSSNSIIVYIEYPSPQRGKVIQYLEELVMNVD